MAELAIKIDNGSGYKDKDILCAFNRRRIRCCHAETICHIQFAPRNSDGLIVPDSLPIAWFESTHQYRFMRVSTFEIVRVEISTGNEEVFSDKPNDRGEQIDVQQFIERRKRQIDNYLFGESGAEFWYGGSVDTSDEKLDTVWAAIESKSKLIEADHAFWPAGSQDLKSHLFIPVNDFDDDTVVELEASQYDDEKTTIEKRKHFCDWESRLIMDASTKSKVRDKAIIVDIRKEMEPADFSTLIQAKI